MRDALRRWAAALPGRYRALLARVRRFERREVRELRRWLEHTGNLVHVSVLVFVPLLIGAVTYLSNAAATVSFLLFPPLASGTYTLFADPEGEYASPVKFVGGMTTGALCGWAALAFSGTYLQAVPSDGVSTGGAALGVFLTGAATWALDLEEPTAFSTALLMLIIDVNELYYTLGVMVTSTLVAAVFLAWREGFYEHRARYLYRTTQSDDHVLVPMGGDRADETATFAAHLAAAHEAGKVVLLDVVDDAEVAAAESAMLQEASAVDEATGPADTDAGGDVPRDVTAAAEEQVAGHAARRLEAAARRIETRVGVPCEVVVAVDGSDHARIVLDTARETNCDLVVAPYEEAHGALTPSLRRLFRGGIDVVVHRPGSGAARGEWDRALVPVRKAGDAAHAMIDFARRVVGRSGRISVCHCIDSESRRREAESMLVDLVETFGGQFETRVSRSAIESFLADNAGQYDVVFVGASTDRSTASRVISPPTFERLADVDCDVAVVHRA